MYHDTTCKKKITRNNVCVQYVMGNVWYCFKPERGFVQKKVQNVLSNLI